jgi:hypothetical protein
VVPFVKPYAFAASYAADRFKGFKVAWVCPNTLDF